jgi:hypothetical protein
MNHEFNSSAKFVNALSSVAITGDTDGLNIDLSGALGAEVIVNCGISAAPADATNFWTYILKEADDDGAGSPDTYTAVASSDMKGAGVVAGGVNGAFAIVNDAAEDAAIYHVSYLGRKPWIRLTCDATLSPGSTPTSAVAALFPLSNSADAA